MIKRIVQLSFLLIGGTLGVVLLPEVFALIHFRHVLITNVYSEAVIGAIVFYLVTFWFIDEVSGFIKWIEEKLVKTPISDMLFGTLGLLLGLIVSFLVSLPINAIRIAGINTIGTIVSLLLTVLLSYLGLQVGMKRRNDFLWLFSGGARRRQKQIGEEELLSKKKILDTSVIIDGRIADICQTGFLEGTIVIPQFVLAELQYIADSSDTLKRTRGRRGLDILNRLQKEIDVKVEMYDGDFEDIQEVDAKLVRLAKKMNGILVTNDFNLNKVSEFQNVPVLNINELANAVKPIVIPGEEMHVVVIKDGKEQNQGIAYLDDGTMIVVDDGKNYMNKDIQVTVTSVLQTSAGRMIFAKPNQKFHGLSNQ